MAILLLKELASTHYASPLEHPPNPIICLITRISKLSPRVQSHALTIDNLPDTLLVEIFRQLPRDSSGRCKCVSKRWFTLLRDPFLCLSRQQEEEFMFLTLNKDFKPQGIEYFVMSHHSAKFKTRRLRMDFLPGFHSKYKRPV